MSGHYRPLPDYRRGPEPPWFWRGFTFTLGAIAAVLTVAVATAVLALLVVALARLN